MREREAEAAASNRLCRPSGVLLCCSLFVGGPPLVGGALALSGGASAGATACSGVVIGAGALSLLPWLFGCFGVAGQACRPTQAALEQLRNDLAEREQWAVCVEAYAAVNRHLRDADDLTTLVMAYWLEPSC